MLSQHCTTNELSQTNKFIRLFEQDFNLNVLIKTISVTEMVFSVFDTWRKSKNRKAKHQHMLYKEDRKKLVNICREMI